MDQDRNEEEKGLNELKNLVGELEQLKQDLELEAGRDEKYAVDLQKLAEQISGVLGEIRSITKKYE